MSTPKFVKYLTDLSLALRQHVDKLGTLRMELRRLNNKFPANVYVPFVCRTSLPKPT